MHAPVYEQMRRRADCQPRTTGRFKATGFGLNKIAREPMSLERGREGPKGLIFIFYRIEKGRRHGEWVILVAAAQSLFAARCISSAQLKAATQVNRLLRRRRREHRKASVPVRSHSEQASSVGHESAARLQLIRHGDPGYNWRRIAQKYRNNARGRAWAPEDHQE